MSNQDIALREIGLYNDRWMLTVDGRLVGETRNGAIATKWLKGEISFSI